MSDENETELTDPPETPEPRKRTPRGYVKVRVLKHGNGKISTGRHVPGQGDETFKFGDIAIIALDIAQALEARGFVEIG
jgi:hypothetical protein